MKTGHYYYKGDKDDKYLKRALDLLCWDLYLLSLEPMCCTFQLISQYCVTL